MIDKFSEEIQGNDQPDLIEHIEEYLLDRSDDEDTPMIYQVGKGFIIA